MFFYKEEGEKLVAGPVWDVDLGFGYWVEREGINMADPNSLWVAVGHLSNELADKESIFTILCKHLDFRMEASRQWKDFFVPQIDTLLKNAEEVYENGKKSIVLDRFKWGQEITLTEMEEQTEGNIQYLYDFINQRANFLTDTYVSENWLSSNYLP